MKKAPTVCFDFDGTIHDYTEGWKGPRNIYGKPVPGMLRLMYDLLNQGWDVVIHSSRARYLFGISAMRSWLRAQCADQGGEKGNPPWHEGMGELGLEDVRFTRWKPAAKVTIDDRALTFTGGAPSIRTLTNFEPWNQVPEEYRGRTYAHWAAPISADNPQRWTAFAHPVTLNKLYVGNNFYDSSHVKKLVMAARQLRNALVADDQIDVGNDVEVAMQKLGALLSLHGEYPEAK